MPSAVRPRSQFPVYSSASPPTVDVGLFTIAKTGVNMKAAGTTAHFTVPAGRTFVAVMSYALVTSVTSGGAGTNNYSIQESSGNRNMLVSSVSDSGTPVANQSVYYTPARAAPGAVQSNCAAGNTVNIVFATSQAGSSAVVGTIYITGFYSS